jgi:hypothetical protein
MHHICRCGEIACGKTVDELRREQIDASEVIAASLCILCDLHCTNELCGGGLQRDQDELAEKMKEIHASFSSSQRDIML